MIAPISMLIDRLPVSLVAISLLVRWLVAQFPYSGQGTPPMYGDYEAQRHWMEVTNQLSCKEWYQNTTNNPLQYWGLDYPPLTAYHMSVLGKISNLLNQSWIELHTSWGHESYEHKIFMRSTVLAADLLVYMPPLIYYFHTIPPATGAWVPSVKQLNGVEAKQLSSKLFSALVLMYPAQILVDHGHFQYNCVFMGLALWAIILVLKAKHGTAAFMFTLALCYKQMSLYYSLPFFWYLASFNLRVRPLWRGLVNIILLGYVVLSSITIQFLPFIKTKQDIIQLITRLFPFYRGLFEDKVANIWYSLSLICKMRQLYSSEQLIKASTILTLVASLPAGIHLMYRPSLRTFRYSLVNTSLVFFLFSYQVHEKTILVPALPILLMFREHPMAVNWFAIVSTFSLQPLLLRDGQIIPYFVLMVIYTLASLELFSDVLVLQLDKIVSIKNLAIVAYLTSIIACFTLNILALTLQPPTRYPHLHPTVNALFSCAHFLGFLLYFYYCQFVSRKLQPKESAKKNA